MNRQTEKYDEIISSLQREFIEQDLIMQKWGENQEKEQMVLMNQLSLIEQENKQLQEHLNKINQNKRQMEELNIYLSREIEQKEQFMQKINEYENQMLVYTDMIEKANVQIEILSSDNTKTKHNLKSALREKKKISGKYEKKKEEYKFLEKELIKTKELFQILEKEKQSLLQDMNIKVEEFITLENKVKELEKLNNKMLVLFEEDQKKNEQLVQDKVSELASAEQKIQELEKKNKELITIIENERKEKTRIIKSLQSKEPEEVISQSVVTEISDSPTLRNNLTEYDDPKEKKNTAPIAEPIVKKEANSVINDPKEKVKTKNLNKEQLEIVNLFVSADRTERMEVRVPVDKYKEYCLALKFLEYRWYQANTNQIETKGESDLAWSEIYVEESAEFFEELEKIVKIPMLSKKYVMMDKEVMLRLKAYKALADYIERHYFKS